MVPMSEPAPLQTFYDAVGGHATFVTLVKRSTKGSRLTHRCVRSPDLIFSPKNIFGCPGALLGSPTTTASSVDIRVCGCATHPLRRRVRDRWETQRDAIDTTS
jgi:hypothetical protein